MSSTELSPTKMTKKHNVSIVFLPPIPTSSFWNELYTTSPNLNTAISISSTPKTLLLPTMPRKTVYVSTQTPKGLMAGLLEVVQNQSGDNHLTVSCMRAMNKYLTDNLRQSTARVNSRSTSRHICRICGSNIADMANAVPSGKFNFEPPQNANDCDHQDPEDMDIDGENGEERQDPIPRFEVPGAPEGDRILVPFDPSRLSQAGVDLPPSEIPQVELMAPVANETTEKPVDEEYPSTEGSDEVSNNPPQIENRSAQSQSDIVVPALKEICAETADVDYPSTEGSDEVVKELPQADNRTTQSQSGAVTGDAPSNWSQTLRDVNQAFYTPTSSDSSTDSSSQSPENDGVQGPRNVNQAFYVPDNSSSSSDSSSQSPRSQGLHAQPSTVPKTTVPKAAPETVNQNTAIQETLAPETIPKTTYRAAAKAASSPVRKSKTDPIRKVKSSPIAKPKTGPIRKIVFSPIRKSVSKAVAETGPTPDETPFAPPRSVNQAFCVPNNSDSDTASEESSLPPHTPQNGSPGHTPFAVPRDANTALCVADDSDSDIPNIPDSPTLRNTSFRTTPTTMSFFQADSSSDGSEEETEDKAETNAQNVTEKETEEETLSVNLRAFLAGRKAARDGILNSEQRLSDLDTSSPCVRENSKDKENSPVPDNTEGDTDEGTDEETNYDPDLIARSLLTSNPNRNNIVGERVSFANFDTPSRPERPYRQAPTSAPHNPNLPTITVRNTDINSEMTVDYQNSVAHDFGVRYGRLRAHVAPVDRNSLTVPATDLRSRARNTSSQSTRSASQHAERQPGEPGPSNLRRVDKRQREDDNDNEEEEESRTPKRVRFAFGTNEHEGNATWPPRRPLRPRRRVWFVDGKRVYKNPEEQS